MSSLTVLVNGASGKMGSLSVSSLEKHPSFSKVISANRDDNLAELLQQHQPDIAVDFTLPDCVFENTKIIIDHGAHPVIGASGLNEKQIKQLQEMCDQKKLGAIIAPNFCLSAALMMHFSSIAAKYYSQVEIIESHHRQKIDAPSATALQTASIINNSLKNDSPDNKNNTEKNKDAARGLKQNQCQIHSLRIDGCFAEQKVIFAGNSEQLILEQRASDRQAMMPGLIIACEQVTKLNKLIYGMENVLLSCEK